MEKIVKNQHVTYFNDKLSAEGVKKHLINTLNAFFMLKYKHNNKMSLIDFVNFDQSHLFHRHTNIIKEIN